MLALEVEISRKLGGGIFPVGEGDQKVVEDLLGEAPE